MSITHIRPDQLQVGMRFLVAADNEFHTIAEIDHQAFGMYSLRLEDYSYTVDIWPDHRVTIEGEWVLAPLEALQAQQAAIEQLDAVLTMRAPTDESAVYQLARYMQARDAKIGGMIVDGVVHPTWEETGLAQEEYQTEARQFLLAAQALGYLKRDKP